jgi:hypothetical protein
MQFEDTGIEGKIVLFSLLESMMDTAHFIRGGQWDWDRVTYDYKFEHKDSGDIYYLRVQGIAVEGEVEQPDAKVELKTPFLGKHYYPHGVEYDEDFPQHVLKTCQGKLQDIQVLLESA